MPAPISREAAETAPRTPRQVSKVWQNEAACTLEKETETEVRTSLATGIDDLVF